MSNPVPLSLTEPYRFAQPLEMDDARAALRECASARRQAREWKQRAMQKAAEAEHEYRKGRAQAWVVCPDGIAKEREDWVNAHTAQLRQDRDLALSLVKAADERLEEVDADRSSVHRLVDWSMKVTPANEPTPEFGPVIGGRAA
jgi:hypothetical protein